MDILELLSTRRSTKNLTTPAPDELQLDSILQAATQVPDHGHLTPWRFVVIQSEAGLQKFRDLCIQTVQDNNMGEEAMKKAHKVGNMAPMILAVIANHKSGKPEWEQTLSAGCAAYAAQLAALAQGFDSVWITGMWVNSNLIRQAFDCTEKDKIIGLIMLGTNNQTPDLHQAKNTDVNQFTTYW